MAAVGPIGMWPLYWCLYVPDTFTAAEAQFASKLPVLTAIRAGAWPAASKSRIDFHRLPLLGDRRRVGVLHLELRGRLDHGVLLRADDAEEVVPCARPGRPGCA